MTIVPASLPRWVFGDPCRLRQVLLNLAGNGVKFTERGHVLLRVGVAGDNEREATLVFSVQDTGIGISAEAQRRLFEPFTQADGSITRKYGGTGLGLAISRRLIEQMGGSIRIASAIGSGSTFSFTLPARKAPNPIDSLASVREKLSGWRVLVGVSSEHMGEMARERLRALGVESSFASSLQTLQAAAVVSTTEGAPFAAVLCDEKMGAEDDFQRLGKSFPMIVLRSIGRHSPVDPAGCGGVGYITKPIREAEFIEKLLKAFCETPKPAPKTAPAAELSAASAVKRVLLAEDNPVNRKVAQRQLQKLGYVADFAVNGLEALRAYESGLYPVILMDCQMPKMDGYKATQAIRRLEKMENHRPARIIAMTADAMPGDRERCMDSGIDDYITKPVNMEHLGSALSRHWTEQAEVFEAVS